MNSNKKYNNIFFWSFLLIIIFAGLYFRLKGLGKWPLAVDEYYIIKSSENILKYGLPKWDVGGYYTRGLPLQYLTALLLLLGVKAEFAGRIIPVIANLIAVPGLYLLAKKISGKVFGFAVVIVFTFSIWEVEFARFARMYAIFQTIFVWYLYFLYKITMEGDDKAFKWLWILSFFSIFVYEGSIFLVVLNFLPIVWDHNKRTINFSSFMQYRHKIRDIVICIGILIIVYFYLTFDFRTLYQANLLPPDVVEYFKNFKSGNLFRKPILLFEAVLLSSKWTLLFFILIVINSIIGFRILKSELSAFAIISFLILIVFSIFNLIGLICTFTLIFLLIGWIRPSDLMFWKEKSEGNINSKLNSSRSFLFISAANFLFWVTYSLNSNDWHKLFPNENISSHGIAIKIMVKEAINYPYFYETFALFRDTIPIATVMSIFFISILILIVLKNYDSEDIFPDKFLLALLIFLILLQNSLSLTYSETRYFFFLYPLMLVIVCLSIYRIASLAVKRNILRKLVFGAIIIFTLILSEDFEAKHLLKIDSPEINFRMDSNFPQTLHYYPRWDSRTPSEIVNRESAADDIIMTNEQTCEYYLNRLDYIFRDYRWAEFLSESVMNGAKERWTNVNMVYKFPELDKMLEHNKHNIWLLINTTWALNELKSLVKKYDKYLHFKSIDGRILLFKIPNSVNNGQ